MEKGYIIAGFGIGCITLVEIIAIRNGINGTGLSLAIGAIAGLGGYGVKRLINKAREKKTNGEYN